MEGTKIRRWSRWRSGRINRSKRRRHRCRGTAQACPWPGAKQGEDKRERKRAREAQSSDSARLIETDDYRRQGVGTSSRGTSDSGAASVGSPRRWISQYVRSNGKHITAAWRPGHAALIGRRSSGREALQRPLHSAVLPLALFSGPCGSPPSLGVA
jgi:hypothetical protein